MNSPISAVANVGSKSFVSSHIVEDGLFAEEPEWFESESIVFSLLSISQSIFLTDNDSEGQFVSQKRFLAR